MNRVFGRWSALLAGAICACTALCADQNINLRESRIVVTFRQENVPVDATFTKFAGNVIYDPANPAGASATLTVATASFDIGDKAYNAEVGKPAWFDSARFGSATFQTATVKAGGAGHFTASGKFTLKGRSQNIDVAVTASPMAHGNAFDGTFRLSRKAFGIGDPTWNDVLDDSVQVRFHLLEAAH